MRMFQTRTPGGARCARPTLLCVLSAAAVAFLPHGSTCAQDAERAAPLAIPKNETVRREFFVWVDARRPVAEVRSELEQAWNAATSASASETLNRLVESTARLDPRVRRLVDACAQPHQPGPLQKQTWLSDPQTDLPPIVLNNLRLYYGRYLVREALYDEALEQLGNLKPEQVVDPTALLFCQAVAYHRLVNREAGLRAADRLLENDAQAPKRYQALAKLIQGDLQGLDEKSLGHIARRMDDIRRRLDLGRAGPRVRAIEDGVIKSLDELIKKLEEQAQEKEQNADGNSRQSGSPAPDSRPLGGKGPGEVTQRNIGTKSGWGNLPPKQRDEAMQQIGRDFPAHYRDVIEQYFRKLANEEK